MRLVVSFLICSFCISSGVFAQENRGMQSQMIAFENNILNDKTDFRSIELITDYREAAATTKGKKQELKRAYVNNNSNSDGKIITFQELLNENEEWLNTSKISNSLKKEKEDHLKSMYPEYLSLFTNYNERLAKRKSIAKKSKRRN